MPYFNSGELSQEVGRRAGREPLIGRAHDQVLGVGDNLTAEQIRARAIVGIFIPLIAKVTTGPSTVEDLVRIDCPGKLCSMYNNCLMPHCRKEE